MRKCLFTIYLLLAVPRWAQTSAIHAGNLLDPATGMDSQNQIILVKDKKIVAVGSNVAIPADRQVIDLSQEWVMPGIAGARTHVTWRLQFFADGDSSYLKERSGLGASRDSTFENRYSGR